MCLLLFPLPGAFLSKEGISESLRHTRSLHIFAESCIPHIMSWQGRNQPPTRLLLPPPSPTSFYGCSAPETFPEPPSPPQVSLVPQPSATLRLSSAGGGEGPHGTGEGNCNSESTAILEKGNLSERPFCMSKNEQIITNTDVSVRKQVSEKGCRFKVCLK